MENNKIDNENSKKSNSTVTKITMEDLSMAKTDALVDEFMEKLFSITRKDQNQQ